MISRRSTLMNADLFRICAQRVRAGLFAGALLPLASDHEELLPEDRSSGGVAMGAGALDVRRLAVRPRQAAVVVGVVASCESMDDWPQINADER